MCLESEMLFEYRGYLAKNPHHLYRVEIKIVDINDNAPLFPVKVFTINITETASPGERFLFLCPRIQM